MSSSSILQSKLHKASILILAFRQVVFHSFGVILNYWWKVPHNILSAKSLWGLIGPKWMPQNDAQCWFYGVVCGEQGMFIPHSFLGLCPFSLLVGRKKGPSVLFPDPWLVVWVHLVTFSVEIGVDPTIRFFWHFIPGCLLSLNFRISQISIPNHSAYYESSLHPGTSYCLGFPADYPFVLYEVVQKLFCILRSVLFPSVKRVAIYHISRRARPV